MRGHAGWRAGGRALIPKNGRVCDHSPFGATRSHVFRLSTERRTARGKRIYRVRQEESRCRKLTRICRGRAGRRGRLRVFTTRYGEVLRRNRSAGLDSGGEENTACKGRQSTNHWPGWACLLFSIRGLWLHSNEWFPHRYPERLPHSPNHEASFRRSLCGETARFPAGIRPERLQAPQDNLRGQRFPGGRVPVSGSRQGIGIQDQRHMS
jgi:hypothetical protein